MTRRILRHYGNTMRRNVLLCTKCHYIIFIKGVFVAMLSLNPSLKLISQTSFLKCFPLLTKIYKQFKIYVNIIMSLNSKYLLFPNIYDITTWCINTIMCIIFYPSIFIVYIFIYLSFTIVVVFCRSFVFCSTPTIFCLYIPYG